MSQVETCTPAVQNPSTPVSPAATPTSPSTNGDFPSRDRQGATRNPSGGDLPLPDGRGSEGLPSTNRRDAKGHFLPGNFGGPGNPYARQTAALRKAAANAITPDEMHNLFRHMWALAMTGNVQAAKFVCDYTVGKPLTAKDPDRVDVHEWEGYKETTQMMAETSGIMKTPEPGLPLDMVRLGRPAVTQQLRNMAGQVLSQPDEAPAEKARREAAESEERKRREAAEAAEAERILNAQVPYPAQAPGQPSTNGGNGPVQPSTNGSNGKLRPSANGSNGQVRPSINGENGNSEPSTNGQTDDPEREALICSIAKRLGYDWPPA
jgi:hypothetical protein